MAAFVRFEAAPDVEAIRDVHLASFPSALEAKLVEELRRAGRLCLSLVAEAGARVVGHVAFSPLDRHRGVGLGPIAVLPEHRRGGVAASLVRRGLTECRSAGAGFVVVLGDPAYYGRFGFEPAARWRLSCEFGRGDDFQALELVAGTIPHDGGLVRYAPEFALFELPEQFAQRCPSCGYDRRASYSDACPECGSTERPKAVRRA